MTIDPRHPLPGSHPLVVGAARSGLAAARLLRAHGLDGRVCDVRSADELAEAATALRAIGAELVAGSDDPSLLADRDLVCGARAFPSATAWPRPRARGCRCVRAGAGRARRARAARVRHGDERQEHDD
jgi:UDP-N-acetylmuramoylalanine--D-glutamate ligase